MTPLGLKARLRADEALVGLLVSHETPLLIEIAGAAGYDFITLDLEHEACNDDSVVGLIRTADAAGIPLVVRMHATERVIPFLSAGARGLQVPRLRSRQHAADVVELVRVPPVGRRSYYTQGRITRYGVGLDEESWLAQENDNFLLVAMIEDIEVVERLDEVLSVEGIDAFHVGPLDLAESMGRPAPIEVEDVIKDVVARCRDAGKFVGVGVLTPWGLDEIPERVEQGVRLFTAASTMILGSALTGYLGEACERLGTYRPRVPPPDIAQNPYLGLARQSG